MQLELLQGPLFRGGGVFPELALFNCSSCHDSSMQRPEWRRRMMTQLQAPGTVPLNDAYWRMSWLIERAIDPPEGARILSQAQGLQRAVLTSRDAVVSQAGEFVGTLRRAEQRMANQVWTTPQSSSLLDSMLMAASDGEFRDYLGAEQAVMAIELLLLDSGQAARLRPQLDTLYRLVKDVDAYRSADFIAGVKALRAAL